MTRDPWVALADDSRPSEYSADLAHLRISQSMHLLELKQQPLILLGERVLPVARTLHGRPRKHQGRKDHREVMVSPSGSG